MKYARMEYIPPELADLIRESCAIKWIIYINGGNATKSSVEDVLLIRHPEVDLATAHDVQNLIEYNGLLQKQMMNKAWEGPDPEPKPEDYPEINQTTYPVKWYRGNPYSHETPPA